jgi:hypothetical protein
MRSTLRVAADVRGFLGGLTHTSLGLSYGEAFALLQDVADAELDAWHEEWRASQPVGVDASVAHCDALLTVLDRTERGVTHRSLYFNDRLDLEQTSIEMGAAPLSADAPLPPAPHHALALGVALQPAAQLQRALNVAVLGAGGCSLPRWLTAALPRCSVEAVEASSHVAAAARHLFGAAALEEEGRFALREQDGRAWIDAQPRGAWDCVMVDVEAGTEEEGRLAPPPEFVTRDALFACARALAPESGVLALNVIAPPERLRDTAADVRAALAPLGHSQIVARPRSTDRQALIFSSPWIGALLRPPPRASAPGRAPTPGSDAAARGGDDAIRARLAEGDVPRGVRALAAGKEWRLHSAQSAAAWRDCA